MGQTHKEVRLWVRHPALVPELLSVDGHVTLFATISLVKSIVGLQPPRLETSVPLNSETYVFPDSLDIPS